MEVMKQKTILAIGTVVLGLSANAFSVTNVNADTYRAKELPRISVSLKELPMKYRGTAPYVEAQTSRINVGVVVKKYKHCCCKKRWNQAIENRRLAQFNYKHTLKASKIKPE